jgi:hypothetical protein
MSDELQTAGKVVFILEEQKGRRKFLVTIYGVSVEIRNGISRI